VIVRATLGQYPGILADVRERGGLRDVGRRALRHLSRAVRHGI
jgi:hypothetical protein